MNIINKNLKKFKLISTYFHKNLLFNFCLSNTYSSGSSTSIKNKEINSISHSYCKISLYKYFTSTNINFYENLKLDNVIIQELINYFNSLLYKDFEFNLSKSEELKFFFIHLQMIISRINSCNEYKLKKSDIYYLFRLNLFSYPNLLYSSIYPYNDNAIIDSILINDNNYFYYERNDISNNFIVEKELKKLYNKEKLNFIKKVLLIEKLFNEYNKLQLNLDEINKLKDELIKVYLLNNNTLKYNVIDFYITGHINYLRSIKVENILNNKINWGLVEHKYIEDNNINKIT